jgi:hypothetical protein
MKVKELYKKIDRLPEGKRIEAINQLLPLLSPISIDALRRFKKGWKGDSPEKFIAQRNKEIKECIEWEFSFVGISTRAIQKLPYFDWDTKLDIQAKSGAVMRGKRSERRATVSVKLQTTEPLIKRKEKLSVKEIESSKRTQKEASEFGKVV